MWKRLYRLWTAHADELLSELGDVQARCSAPAQQRHLFAPDLLRPRQFSTASSCSAQSAPAACAAASAPTRLRYASTRLPPFEPGSPSALAPIDCRTVSARA